MRGMAASAAIGGLLAATAIAPAASGAATYPETLAQRLDREVVVVERGARPRVSQREAGEVRLRIVRKDLGRIKIAVVSERSAADNGGVTGLGQAIDRHLDLRGTLIVVGGSRVYAITSYPRSDVTAQALQEAFNRHKGDRPKQLLAAVDAVAAVDPGPRADPSPASPNVPDLTDEAEGLFDAFRIGALIVAGAVALPFVIFTAWFLLRLRRRRRQAEEVEADRELSVRDRLVTLGDEIRALDLDTQMPGVTSTALTDYEGAIAQYDRANAMLARADENSPHRVEEASAAVAEGIRRIESAKAQLGGAPAGPGG